MKEVATPIWNTSLRVCLLCLQEFLDVSDYVLPKTLLKYDAFDTSGLRLSRFVPLFPPVNLVNLEHVALFLLAVVDCLLYEDFDRRCVLPVTGDPKLLQDCRQLVFACFQLFCY